MTALIKKKIEAFEDVMGKNTVSKMAAPQQTLSYVVARQLTKKTIRGFFVSFVKLCGKTDPICGQQRTPNVTTPTHSCPYRPSIPHQSKPHHLPIRLPILQILLCDFWLFLKQSKKKKSLKVRFDSMEDIKQNSKAQFYTILKSDFHRCFQQSQEHWQKRVGSQSEYF